MGRLGRSGVSEIKDPAVGDPVIFRDERKDLHIALVSQIRKNHLLDLVYVVPIRDHRGPGQSWTRSVWAIKPGTERSTETSRWYTRD